VAHFEYLTAHSPSGLLTSADADRVAAALRQGALAVLPTETGYLLGARATDQTAVRAAFRVKGRDTAHTMHIACASLAMAEEFAQVTPAARRVLGALTPGPVSVVVARTDRLPDGLVTVDDTVGIRIPDHPATLQVIGAVGEPLTATSLNRSGEPAMSIHHVELESLDWPPGGIVYVVEDDHCVRYPLPSTLVRFTTPTPEILRPGPVTEATIAAAASALHDLLDHEVWVAGSRRS
jgi:L-threonylcarbamoyladenylate synthase